jgi:hypothetical protein
MAVQNDSTALVQETRMATSTRGSTSGRTRSGAGRASTIAWHPARPLAAAHAKFIVGMRHGLSARG